MIRFPAGLSKRQMMLTRSVLVLTFVSFAQASSNSRLAAQEAGPEARRAHTMTYHSGLGLVVIFGGEAADGEILADLWGWDGEDWRLLDGGEAGPPPRSRHAMAYDPLNDRLVTHGGGSVEEDLGDTWAWTVDGWIRLETGGPGPRSHHHMAYDSASNGLVLYGGGRSGDEFGHDTWILHGGKWRMADARLRPGRVLAGVASSPRGILLFGGLIRGAPRSSELWRWSGDTWSLIHSAGPPPLIYPGLTWDHAEERLLLFGGEGDAGLTAEMWAWNGSDWTRCEDMDRPPPRTEHGLAHDRSRGLTVLFGGRTADGIADDVWEWDDDRWVRVW